MPFRRRGFRNNRGRSSRNKEWITWTSSLAAGYFTPNMIELAPGNLAVSWIIAPEDARIEWDEPTIVRSLIRFNLFLSGSPSVQASQYDATFRGGLITWKGNTHPALPTSVPDIEPADGSLDWIWWDEIHLEHPTATNAIGSTDAPSFGTDYMGRMDIKSKRKMELGTGLLGAFILEPSSSVNVYFMFSGRALLLNH